MTREQLIKYINDNISKKITKQDVDIQISDFLNMPYTPKTKLKMFKLKIEDQHQNIYFEFNISKYNCKSQQHYYWGIKDPVVEIESITFECIPFISAFISNLNNYKLTFDYFSNINKIQIDTIELTNCYTIFDNMKNITIHGIMNKLNND